MIPEFFGSVATCIIDVFLHVCAKQVVVTTDNKELNIVLTQCLALFLF